MMKMVGSKAIEVVKDSKPELKVNDKSGPEVVAKLVSLQEEISSQPIEVVELPMIPL